MLSVLIVVILFKGDIMQRKFFLLSLSFLLVSLLLFLALAPIVQATEVILAAPVNYRVGNAPNYVAAADFTGDGKPDLAVVHALMSDGSPYGGPSVLLNNGAGTFGTASDYDGGYLPKALRWGILTRILTLTWQSPTLGEVSRYGLTMAVARLLFTPTSGQPRVPCPSPSPILIKITTLTSSLQTGQRTKRVCS